jgi:hypothetical protein
MWQSYIKHFKDYLRLERSLSGNSVEAYIRDVEKLEEFVALASQDRRVTSDGIPQVPLGAGPVGSFPGSHAFGHQGILQVLAAGK